MKKFKRYYHFDEPEASGVECDEKGWAKEGDIFNSSADLYVEVQDLWNCEEFSMELQDWCDNANIGDVYEDEDIRVVVCE